MLRETIRIQSYLGLPLSQGLKNESVGAYVSQ